MKAIVSLLTVFCLLLGGAGIATAEEHRGLAGLQLAAAERVNINSANVETLTSLHSIGAKKAQAIIDYRKANGKFRSKEELLEVKGIGEKTLERNRARIVF